MRYHALADVSNESASPGFSSPAPGSGEQLSTFPLMTSFAFAPHCNVLRGIFFFKEIP
jgi:hypothetical protein